jgi:hypothetical protein
MSARHIDAIRTEIESQVQLVPSLTVQVRNLVASGGTVMVEGADTFETQGKSFDLEVVGMFEVDGNARIARLGDYYDLNSLMDRIAATGRANSVAKQFAFVLTSIVRFDMHVECWAATSRTSPGATDVVAPPSSSPIEAESSEVTSWVRSQRKSSICSPPDWIVVTSSVTWRGSTPRARSEPLATPSLDAIPFVAS